MVSLKTMKIDDDEGKLIRPYNNYNIYYILERELLIQTRSDATSCVMRHQHDQQNGSPFTKYNNLTGYEYLELPPLPTRYQQLKLPHDWYMPGKKKNVKRSHTKTHGVASFGEIARTVGATWKVIDDATLSYVNEVAMILKKRHKQLAFMGGVGCFVAMDSRHLCSKQSPKKQHRSSLHDYIVPKNLKKTQSNRNMQSTRQPPQHHKSDLMPGEMDLSTLLEEEQ